MRMRHSFALVSLLLSNVSTLDDGYDPLRYSPPRLSLLRLVEKSLSGTAGVVRGVGDAIAVGTGGTIRMVGGSIQSVGDGLEGIGDVVAGEQSRDRDYEDEDGATVDGALRSIASRPIRIVGRVLRAVGDTTNFFGDTTERMAAEAIGILPDAVQVIGSSVRSVREKIDGDGYVAFADDGRSERPFHHQQVHAGMGAGSLEQGTGLQGAGGSAAAAASSSSKSASGGSSEGRATAQSAAQPTNSEASPSRVRQKVSRLRKRIDATLTRAQGGGTDSIKPHLLLGLAAVAMAARSSVGPLGLATIILLALLYVGQMESEQRTRMRREAAAAERHALYFDPRMPLIAEPVGWLNAVVASSWHAMLMSYLTTSVFEEVSAQLDELVLPKSLRAIHLLDLQLGPRPPTIRSLSATPALGPSPNPRDGCMAQAELEWEAPDASATLSFRLANVQSQPRLRVRRARVRVTVRMHFEWLAESPYVGRIRFALVKP